MAAGAAATAAGAEGAAGAGLGWLASTSTLPTGFRRLATASFESAGLSLEWSAPPVTRLASMAISPIGIAKASTTTMMSCLGVLIGEECSWMWISAMGSRMFF
jgi:hypothetical protein